MLDVLFHCLGYENKLSRGEHCKRVKSQKNAKSRDLYICLQLALVMQIHHFKFSSTDVMTISFKHCSCALSFLFVKNILMLSPVNTMIHRAYVSRLSYISFMFFFLSLESAFCQVKKIGKVQACATFQELVYKKHP